MMLTYKGEIYMSNEHEKYLFDHFQAARDRYWERTLRPLTHRFNGIIARPDLKKIYNEDKVRSRI